MSRHTSGHVSTFGVHLVACAGGSKCSAFVEAGGIDEFGVDLVAGSSGSEVFACGSVARLGVAGLYHEFVDEAGLNALQEELIAQATELSKFTPQQREAYTTVGGPVP